MPERLVPDIPPDIPGVILAGGQSRRMGGGDKTLLPLGGQTVLGRVIDRLRPQVGAMMLNANGDPERFAAFGLPVLPDTLPDHPGPLAGVLAGLDWAAGAGASRIVTVAADTPFFPLDLVATLAAAAEAESQPIALAATPLEGGRGGRHPVFGLWPVSLRGDLRAALEGGTRKIVAWADQHGTATARFSDTPFDPFFNINTAEDIARAETILQQTA